MFVEGKKIPTELRKDTEELKDSSLYDDVERSGECSSMWSGLWSAV